ncbi:lytic transglycosylase domain-containing protein [Candidatus Woesearchaeota archaeon]|nr:lytic transglycosylase domain-containing protein [Candidatus Woesearchaeota archaeon]
MRLKIIALLIVLLIAGVNFHASIALAQIQGSTGSPQFGNAYDSDSDGICDAPRGSAKHQGQSGFSSLGCNDNAYGDLCPGTFLNDRPVGSSSTNSGCGPSQTARLINFWSVSRGELTPKTLKVNWITDTRNGVLVYQIINLIRNPVFSNRKIELRDVSVSCDSGTGIDKTSGQYREIPGGFISDARIVPADDTQNEGRAIQFSVRQRSDQDVRTKSAIALASERIKGIDEIKTTCRITINQCEKDGKTGDCFPMYPAEQDEIDFFIPIDTLAVQPPEFALAAGIDFAEKTIKITDDLIHKFTKIYQFTLKWCSYSIAAVLATKFLKFITGGFGDLAELIWYGPEGLRRFGFEEKSFVISGRSMCAAALCPKNWCKFANIETGQKQVQEYVDLDKDGKPETPVWEQDEKGNIKYYPGKDGGITTTPIPKLTSQKITLGSKTVNIQDSLILSAGCGCISGILTNLYEIRAIADSWRTCLLEAKTGGAYTARCDQLLNHGICKFVLQELDSFHGTDLLKRAFSVDKGGVLGDGETRGATEDARIAQGLKEKVKDSVDDAKRFAKDDLVELGMAAGGGVLGYNELQLESTICSLAIYQRLPQIDAFTRFDFNRPVLKTSISLNWDSKPLFQTPTGERMFEYSLDWMILAGRDNLRYEVYLESFDGKRSPRLDRQSGYLNRAGDYHSDFVQILDTTDYTRACVSIPNEFPEPRCFPIGKGGDDTIFGEFKVYGVELDTDKDGMPDEWELEMGFKPDDARDAAQDEDMDGLSNLREYSLGTNPKSADDPGNKPLSVEFARSDCRAVFNKDIEFLGKTEIIPRYQLGDMIEVNPVSLVTITRPSDGVQIKVEITGEGVNFNKIVRINAHDVANNARFVVWGIPKIGAEVPYGGMYNIKFSLVKSAALSDPLCGDERGLTINSIREKKIVIYDPAFSGCSDFGGHDISRQQACISGNGNVQIKIDECVADGKLVEYSCKENQCVSQLVGCPTGSVCQNGRCTLAKEVKIPIIPIPTEPAKVIPVPTLIPPGPYATEPTTGTIFEQTKTNLGYPGGETFNYVRNTVKEIFGDSAATALPLILGMITQESKGNRETKPSSKGAIGLMQIMPDAQSDVNSYLRGKGIQATKERGIWQDNVYIGVLYFKFQIDKYKDFKSQTDNYNEVKLALAAYNAGPGFVDRACTTLKNFEECKSFLPKETQNYVPSVMKHAEAWRGELKIPGV